MGVDMIAELKRFVERLESQEFSDSQLADMAFRFSQENQIYFYEKELIDIFDRVSLMGMNGRYYTVSQEWIIRNLKQYLEKTDKDGEQNK